MLQLFCLFSLLLDVRGSSVPALPVMSGLVVVHFRIRACTPLLTTAFDEFKPGEILAMLSNERTKNITSILHPDFPGFGSFSR